MRKLGHSLLSLVVATTFILGSTAVFGAVPTPATPSNVRARAVSTSSIEVSWSMTGVCDGFLITISNATVGRHVTCSGNTTQADTVTKFRKVVTGLQSDTRYQVELNAYNDDPNAPEYATMGDPDWAVLSGTTAAVSVRTDSPLPQAPTNLTGIVVSAEAVELHWDDNSSNESGFKVERARATEAWIEVATRPQDWPQWTDVALSTGETYTYRVLAYNAKGSSGYSNEFTIRVDPADIGSGVPPAAPGNLVGTAIAGEAIELSWEDLSDNEAGFVIERAAVDGAWSEVAVRPLDWPLWTDIGIDRGNTYVYRVFAYNQAGPSEYSNELTITLVAEEGIDPPDVAEASEWARDEIHHAWHLGLTSPRILTGFQTPITREEFCEIAVLLCEKLSGQPSVPVAVNPFVDTDHPAVLKAYALGITNGITANEFAPLNQITRQEMCTMLVRAAAVVDPDLTLGRTDVAVFADQDLIAPWALSNVQLCYQMEVMRGVGANAIDPLGYTTREQAICLVRRMHDAVAYGE